MTDTLREAAQRVVDALATADYYECSLNVRVHIDELEERLAAVSTTSPTTDWKRAASLPRRAVVTNARGTTDRYNDLEVTVLLIHAGQWICICQDGSTLVLNLDEIYFPPELLEDPS